MDILAIETSCDETAAAVVRDGRKIISSAVYTQIAEHRLYGGVVPEIASRRHIEQLCPVTEKALAEAKIPLQKIDAIAVTAGPGLIGALLAGVNFAKGLSLSANKPLIPVHHIRGHIAACYLTDEGLVPPFLCLAASGGNSLIAEVVDYTEFRLLGHSRDDAAGEAFDKAARAMGLPYPGGVSIDALAVGGDEKKYKLPIPRVEGAPMDMSFSGVKTSIVNLLHNSKQKGEELDLPSLAASFQKTVCDALIKRLMLASQMTGIKTVAVAGGVSANSYLRGTLKAECKKLGLRLIMPPLTLTGDNAAMIGAQAFFEYQKGNVAGGALNAVATLSVENGSPRDFYV